jgi:hypothetical protein
MVVLHGAANVVNRIVASVNRVETVWAVVMIDIQQWPAISSDK